MSEFILILMTKPFWFVVILLAAFVAGSVWMYRRCHARGVHVAYRRVRYAWSLALLSVGGTVAVFLFMFLPMVARLGVLPIFFVLILLSFAAVGAGYVRASAARSQDIDGTVDHMWWVFVPIASLYLVFRKSDRAERRDSIDIGLDVVALCCLIFPYWVSVEIEDELLSRGTIVAELSKAMIEGESDPAVAARLASYSMSDSFYWRTFSDYRLQDVDAVQDEVRLVYAVRPEWVRRFNETPRLAALEDRFERFCDGRTFGRLHDKGVRITMSFFAPQEGTLAVFQSSAEACTV